MEGAHNKEMLLIHKGYKSFVTLLVSVSKFSNLFAILRYYGLTERAASQHHISPPILKPNL
jgi:hypothetical protein